MIEGVAYTEQCNMKIHPSAGLSTFNTISKGCKHHKSHETKEDGWCAPCMVTAMPVLRKMQKIVRLMIGSKGMITGRNIFLHVVGIR